MTRPLWEHTDQDGDSARLGRGPTLDGDPRPGAVGHLALGQESCDLDRAAAETLREALDRLLDVDEQQPAPASRDLQRVAAAVADQLRESVAARAREFACRDAGWLAIDVQILAVEVRGLARALAGGEA